MTDGPQVAGVVLAAGLGRRMGRPKAEIMVDGTRLIDRATARLREAGCTPVIAVVAPGVDCDALLAVNPDPESGQRSSLAAGLRVVPASSVAVAVTLVDMPGMTSAAIAEVVRRWMPGRIAVGVTSGRRTHPTVMSPQMWRAAIELAGADEGARRYVALHSDLVDEVPVDIDATDLDEPGDLESWARSR